MFQCLSIFACEFDFRKLNFIADSLDWNLIQLWPIFFESLMLKEFKFESL